MQDRGGVLVCNWPPILPLLEMQDGGGGFSSNHPSTPSLARNTRWRGNIFKITTLPPTKTSTYALFRGFLHCHHFTAIEDGVYTQFWYWVFVFQHHHPIATCFGDHHLTTYENKCAHSILKTSTYTQFQGWLVVFQQHQTTPLKMSTYACFQCFPSPPPLGMSSYTRFRWWVIFLNIKICISNILKLYKCNFSYTQGLPVTIPKGGCLFG